MKPVGKVLQPSHTDHFNPPTSFGSHDGNRGSADRLRRFGGFAGIERPRQTDQGQELTSIAERISTARVFGQRQHLIVAERGGMPAAAQELPEPDVYKRQP